MNRTSPARYKFAALVIALSLLPLAYASGSQSQPDQSLPHFHQVNQHLYRGAQPRKGGLKRLAELGIKTVINLRGESEGTRDEETEAKEAGLTYFSLPMSALGRPDDEVIERALAIINDAQYAPVFVHCKHGEDRTGTLVACYRISRDGWTAEQALEEAKSFGMMRIQFRMKSYIKDYHRKHNSRQPNARQSRQQ